MKRGKFKIIVLYRKKETKALQNLAHFKLQHLENMNQTIIMMINIMTMMINNKQFKQMTQMIRNNQETQQIKKKKLKLKTLVCS